jgi:internalin A
VADTVIEAWDRFSECQPGYDEDGLFFEHFPLAYWLDYIREMSPGSPVLVIENKCDDGRGSAAPVAVPGPYLVFSAKENIGQDAVTGWIRETSRRELTNLGARTIGIGRWQVKQTLLDYKEQDESRAPADRQYRTISYAHFQQLCDAQDGCVSSARELLRYLHNTGVVYYQEHLFNQQIILDQRWAIEAIYTIFHRQKSYRQLKRRGGRFRPSDLHDLVWEGEYTQEEQRLFLTFMASCALCFRLSKWDEYDPEYLAPDLLPVLQDNREYLLELNNRRQQYGEDVLYYRYTQPFLHQGVMRRFMVTIGRMFRDRALYWKDGLCIALPQSQAMAIIACARHIEEHPSKGRITVEVRGRQRHALLHRIRNTFAQLTDRPETLEQAVSLDGADWIDVADLERARLTGTVVSQQGRVLDARDFLFVLSKEPDDDLRHDAPYTPEETVMPSSRPTVYISYAWGDPQETGVSREDIVNQLYETLIREGYNVKRDKMDLEYKGLISQFMADIGRGDCVVVIISDKYLKSPYCMHELLAIYQNDPRSRGLKVPAVFLD